ncbi:helix-turn-helix domain-containing protein [Streptomyces cinerochromogenes]|uniref:Helix-turn-helix domain-containing protein n=1 Tax=Streptomyces cinerochromogenes TaxID=66422 RepID=A0ABW7B9B7_9ACTN
MFRSEDVPAEERFDHWRKLLDQSRSSKVTSSYAADFRAECRRLELGPTTVLAMSCAPARYRRSTRMVQYSDAEQYHLSLLLDGEAELDHAGRTHVFGPGDWHLVDNSRPYDLRLADDGGGRGAKAVGLDLPKALLPIPSHQVHRLLGRRLPGHEGIGALLTEYVLGVERQAGDLRSVDAPRLGTVVLDLLSTWIAQLLETEAAIPPEARHSARMESIMAFIRRNLHDPCLTPPAIAAAHHISLSYLHRIFRQHTRGESVAAWIRRQRLEGTLRDLADPALRDTPIHLIGTRWGLTRASDFTRAFRTAYGLSPRAFRLQAFSTYQSPATRP